MRKLIILSALLFFKSLNVMASGEMYITASGDYKAQHQTFDLSMHDNILALDDRPQRKAFNIDPHTLLSTMQKPDWVNATIIQTKDSGLQLLIGEAVPNCEIIDEKVLRCITKENLDAYSDAVRLFNLSFSASGQSNYILTGNGLTFSTNGKSLFVTLQNMAGAQYTRADDHIVSTKVSAQDMMAMWKEGGKKSFQSMPPNGFVNFHIDGDIQKMVSLPALLKNPKANGDAITFEMDLLPTLDDGFKGLSLKDLVTTLNGFNKNMVSIFVDHSGSGYRGLRD